MLRRGFKSWCETTSVNYRNALGIDLDQALDPKQLASYLGILVWRPEDVPGLSEEKLRQLTVKDPDGWDAVTLLVNGSRLTIINSADPQTRQNNSVAHELAHIILDHKPGRIDVSEQGLLLLNTFDKEQEEEANWLAGAILVPREGLLMVYRQLRNAAATARQFEVSSKLVNWRLRMTGVLAQMQRAAKWRGR